jgi:hypothetical protein
MSKSDSGSGPQRLDYATPTPRPQVGRWGLEDFWIVGRRAIFALGCAMLVFGICDTFTGGGNRDAMYIAAWGAAFVGLTMPWPRQSL